MIDLNLEQLQNAHIEASEQANDFVKDMDDTYECGFAWVELKIDGRSALSKQLKKIGFEASWVSSKLMLWNPSSYPMQAVAPKVAGANVYAEVFEKLTGIKLAVCSRLD